MIRAVVTDERGAEIGEAFDFLNSWLPIADDQSFRCMNFIDPYGTTIFNGLQVAVALKELGQLKERCHTDEQLKTVRRLEALCEKCLAEPHLYLRFIGD